MHLGLAMTICQTYGIHAIPTNICNKYVYLELQDEVAESKTEMRKLTDEQGVLNEQVRASKPFHTYIYLYMRYMYMFDFMYLQRTKILSIYTHEWWTYKYVHLCEIVSEIMQGHETVVFFL